ncbi:phospholipase A and acyltransferase 4-like [Centropristis striata]|uniref:phospholipase A and acyltransferase 4-like n=1 Tax=Centropristis striata TaxID=184440 RepID=UPI0027E033FC|nr:phospholipase A and acyltransferase 4-like [Centropristis striata]
MAPTLFEHGAKPGDLIEIFRGTYEHWAIYIGGDEVIHLIPPNDESSPFVLALLDSNKAQVKRQKICEVVLSNRFIINNLLDDKYEPRDPYMIVNDACKMVGRELPYSLTSFNCEHFVTQLRYGKPESRQVKTAAVIGGAAVVGVGLLALGAVLFGSLHNKDRRNDRHYYDDDDDD